MPADIVMKQNSKRAFTSASDNDVKRLQFMNVSVDVWWIRKKKQSLSGWWDDAWGQDDNVRLLPANIFIEHDVSTPKPRPSLLLWYPSFPKHTYLLVRAYRWRWIDRCSSVLLCAIKAHSRVLFSQTFSLVFASPTKFIFFRQIILLNTLFRPWNSGLLWVYVVQRRSEFMHLKRCVQQKDLPKKTNSVVMFLQRSASKKEGGGGGGGGAGGCSLVLKATAASTSASISTTSSTSTVCLFSAFKLA